VKKYQLLGHKQKN